MQWLFNYVGQVLNYERISRQPNETHSEFRAWFEARYPSIAREAEGLLALIDDVGIDRPSEQRILFREVIRRYQLNGAIFLEPSQL
jgi:hypothetical protein